MSKDLQLAYAKVFKPFSTLYLVGGCCALAWNYWDGVSSHFNPNPSKPEELIWEGYLSPNWNDSRDEPNKLKILTAPDWFSETYHPYVADDPWLANIVSVQQVMMILNGLSMMLVCIVLRSTH